MLGYIEDLFGDALSVGDTVIASRPAGAGTTELEFCEIIKINDGSVSLRPLERDGTPKKEQQYNYKTRQFEDGHKKAFSLQKAYGKSDQCRKIVRFIP